MKDNQSFINFFKNVCTRPGMWTPTGSFNEVLCLIDGYTMGSQKTALSGDSGWNYHYYVCNKYGFPSKYATSYVIKTLTQNDEEAIKLYMQTTLEFIEFKKTMSDEEIIEYAKINFTSEEGDAEKVFRQFDNALLEGDKEIIDSLIEDNENKEILWKRAYPKDVANLLGQISNAQPIKRIYESEDKTKVKILTGEFPFPFEMNFKNGKWIINAKPLIELRMSMNQDK